MTLFNKHKHFTWTDTNGNISYDAPTMLFIIISSINPDLRLAKLVNFQYNVINMTNKMLADDQLNMEKKGKHDDMVLDVFDALFSGKNEIFTSFVQCRKDDMETGTKE